MEDQIFNYPGDGINIIEKVNISISPTPETLKKSIERNVNGGKREEEKKKEIRTET